MYLREIVYVKTGTRYNEQASINFFFKLGSMPLNINNNLQGPYFSCSFSSSCFCKCKGCPCASTQFSPPPQFFPTCYLHCVSGFHRLCFLLYEELQHLWIPHFWFCHTNYLTSETQRKELALVQKIRTSHREKKHHKCVNSTTFILFLLPEQQVMRTEEFPRMPEVLS